MPCIVADEIVWLVRRLFDTRLVTPRNTLVTVLRRAGFSLAILTATASTGWAQTDGSNQSLVGERRGLGSQGQRQLVGATATRNGNVIGAGVPGGLSVLWAQADGGGQLRSSTVGPVDGHPPHHADAIVSPSSSGVASDELTAGLSFGQGPANSSSQAPVGGPKVLGSHAPHHLERTATTSGDTPTGAKPTSVGVTSVGVTGGPYFAQVPVTGGPYFAQALVPGSNQIQGRGTGLSGNYTTNNLDGIAAASGANLRGLSLGGGLSVFLGFYGDPVSTRVQPSPYQPFVTKAIYNFNLTQDNTLTIELRFSQLMKAVAFNFSTLQGGASTFEIWKDNLLIDVIETTVPQFCPTGFGPTCTANQDLFWGFDLTNSNQASFNRLVLKGDQRAFGVDNLQFVAAPTTAVPEPTTVGLVAFGLFGLGIVVRRRSRERRPR